MKTTTRIIARISRFLVQAPVFLSLLLLLPVYGHALPSMEAPVTKEQEANNHRRLLTKALGHHARIQISNLPLPQKEFPIEEQAITMPIPFVSFDLEQELAQAAANLRAALDANPKWICHISRVWVESIPPDEEGAITHQQIRAHLQFMPVHMSNQGAW